MKRTIGIASHLPLLFVVGLQTPSAARIDRQVYLMGTVATLETYASDRETGLDWLEALIEVLETTESELSTWQSQSILSRINRHALGAPFPVDPTLCRMFRELERWHRETGGAFDPAIGALVEAWGLRAAPRRPDESELRSALASSGLDGLSIESDCLVVRERDVILDAGAFGKGEALDRMRAEAVSRGIPNWMVDLGGQVMVDGMPGADDAWEVALADPTDRQRPVAYVHLTDGSLATSGGSERDASAGQERLGHILDPRSGRPVSRNSSVVVWHSRGLIADILSTALYVMGVDEGLRWAEAHGVSACFLIPTDESVEIRPSSRFSARFLD